MPATKATVATVTVFFSTRPQCHLLAVKLYYQDLYLLLKWKTPSQLCSYKLYYNGKVRLLFIPHVKNTAQRVSLYLPQAIYAIHGQTYWVNTMI